MILLRIAQAIPRRVVSRNCVNGSLFHPTSTLKVSHQSRDDTTKSYALPIAQRIADAIGQFHSVAVRFVGRLFVTVCVTIFSASISLISLSVLFGNHSHSGVTVGSHGVFGGLAVGSIQRSFRSSAICTGTDSDIVWVDGNSPVRKYAGDLSDIVGSIGAGCSFITAGSFPDAIRAASYRSLFASIVVSIFTGASSRLSDVCFHFIAFTHLNHGIAVARVGAALVANASRALVIES